MQFDNYRVRLMEENDADDFYNLVKNNLARLDFFSGTVSKTQSPEDTQAYVKENLDRISDRQYYPHVVIDTQTNKMIGFIDLKNIDWNIPKGELGCFIDEQFTRKNISYKVMRLFINHAFNGLGIRKLFLRTHILNLPACKLAEKCGFKTEGIIRKDYKTNNGELVDLVYYGMLKEEFDFENEGEKMKVDP